MSKTAGKKPGRHVEGARTRQRVLTVATDLMASKGYSGTSISDISRAAETNPASIYWAFGNKEGLFAAIMERAAEDFFEEVGSRGEGPPWETIEQWADLFRGGPIFLRLLLVLTLERDGDASAMAAARRVRLRAREGLEQAISSTFELDDEVARQRICDSMARFTLMTLDGLFVSNQIEPEEQSLEDRLAVVAASLRATTESLVTAAGGRMR